MRSSVADVTSGPGFTQAVRATGAAITVSSVAAAADEPVGSVLAAAVGGRRGGGARFGRVRRAGRRRRGGRRGVGGVVVTAGHARGEHAEDGRD